MNKIYNEACSSPVYYIGIMSGTSLDGIDVILADFASQRPSLLYTLYQPYDRDLRHQILDLHQSSNNELHLVSMLNNKLAKYYANAVINLLNKHNIKPDSITAIGCHGQTIRHCPEPSKGYSIQLGNASLLAELTGITVVADFRSRDIAAGGQGAPLVPAFHQLMFQDQKINRAIVNIGGISNITNLSSNKKIIGFDCGPGNLLMDAWCQRHLGTKYDNNGIWAESGEVIPKLLEELISLEFFSIPPPKSTGREIFNLTWLENHLSGNEKIEDVQATLLQLTCTTITNAIRKWIPDTSEVYLCGGGARNIALSTKIRISLLNKKVALTDVLGIDADWLEALSFAWLAKQTIQGLPGNLPSVTNAKGERILGAIYQA
ncbi:MAG: anhydro-N-acetylmuramic acid kinase [Nitrosomonadaceae bacterium]|nr:anhydro-N-acetylmuramic acid kinase [Nitrosomonadaceae bacterium]|tara:strand:- start:781 stop:1908 length:1128 start_codon:yes stop_codon:yes gene_type:complete